MGKKKYSAEVDEDNSAGDRKNFAEDGLSMVIS